jgi:hypothetical protein
MQFTSSSSCFSSCNLSRYVNSDIPSDLLVKVGDVSFNLHKVLLSFVATEYNHPEFARLPDEYVLCYCRQLNH